MNQASFSPRRRSPHSIAALLLLLPLVHSNPSATPKIASTPSPQASGPVGVNLNTIEYWNGGFIVADLAKRGQVWMLSSTGATPAKTNSAGWPLEPSTSRIVISGYQRPERLATGSDDVMVLRFREGSATATTKTDVEAFGPGVTEVASNRASDGTITKEYTVAGAEGAITLRTVSVNSNDAAGSGVNMDPNTEFWIDKAHMRAFDQNPEAVFHDFYLQRLAALAPDHLRTSTWCRALYASDTLLAVSDNRKGYDPIAQPRLKPNAPQFSGFLPVPWELHAWMANEIQADLWVDIPFVYYAVGDAVRKSAAEDYIKEMARTLKAELDPNLTCIVEFSNEMWNSNFSTYKVLDEKEGPINPSLVARFVVDAFTWWSEEWNEDRVEFVAMGFTGDTNWVTEQTDALKGLGLIDAVGCGGYYFPRREDSSAWGDKNPTACGNLDSSNPALELQAAISMFLMIENNQPFGGSGGIVPGTTHSLRAHGQVALDLEAELGRPIGLYVYEGGPSLLTGCSELQNLYAKFQKSSIYSFALLYYELSHVVDGFRAGSDFLDQPLEKLVGRFSYFAFCQPQNPRYGDWLLLTDLFAGIPGVSVVDPQIQWKYEAVRLFNANH